MAYDTNEDVLFKVEYADELDVRFGFTAKLVVAPQQPPSENFHVRLPPEIANSSWLFIDHQLPHNSK